jgi:hypothetical protein
VGGCIYSVDPHIRTAEELVITLFRERDVPHETRKQKTLPKSTQQDSRYLPDFQPMNAGHTQLNPPYCCDKVPEISV